jgi:hypothetical protein
MTGLPQHQTMKSLPRTDGLFRSGKQHPRWLGSSVPGLKGKIFGSVTITSSLIHRVKGSPYVLAKCSLSGTTKLTCLSNLKNGKTTSFLKNGKRPVQHAAVLGRRYDAIFARCNNPMQKHWKDYGGRGIKCLFETRMEFILWVVSNLPHKDYKGMEIDRMDNNGNYEPGNLRLATRRENILNRRNTAKIMWLGRLIPLADFPSPYSPNWTYQLMRRGLTGEQVFARLASTT